MSSSKNSYLNGKDILITGATGLIGSWLVKDLMRQNANISIIINNSKRPSELSNSSCLDKVSRYYGNIQDLSLVKEIFLKNHFDIVFHLASINWTYGSQFSPIETYETNIKGTYNILECCRLTNNRFLSIIILSSREIYSESHADSKGSILGRSYHPYEVSKRTVGLLCESFARTYALNIKVLISSNIYGGGDFNWSRIVPGTIRSILNNENPTIRTDGTIKRNYIYVEDIVRAIKYISFQKNSDTNYVSNYNIKDYDLMASIDLVKKMILISGNINLKPVVLDKSKDEKRFQNVLGFANVEDLGWLPKFSIDEGLLRTYKWYLKYSTNYELA